MKLPRSLKIGVHLVAVEVLPLDDICGESDQLKNLIRINSEMPQSQQEATLIHEIFHFLNSTLGDDVVSHALIDSLSEQFYAVLKENDLLK